MQVHRTRIVAKGLWWSDECCEEESWSAVTNPERTRSAVTNLECTTHANTNRTEDGNTKHPGQQTTIWQRRWESGENIWGVWWAAAGVDDDRWLVDQRWCVGTPTRTLTHTHNNEHETSRKHGINEPWQKFSSYTNTRQMKIMIYMNILIFTYEYSKAKPYVMSHDRSSSIKLDFSHHCQVRKGGGTGLLISNNWKYLDYTPLCNNFSLESHAITVTAPVKLHVVVIYRPPG